NPSYAAYEPRTRHRIGFFIRTATQDIEAQREEDARPEPDGPIFSDWVQTFNYLGNFVSILILFASGVVVGLSKKWGWLSEGIGPTDGMTQTAQMLEFPVLLAFNHQYLLIGVAIFLFVYLILNLFFPSVFPSWISVYDTESTTSSIDPKLLTTKDALRKVTELVKKRGKIMVTVVTTPDDDMDQADRTTNRKMSFVVSSQNLARQLEKIAAWIPNQLGTPNAGSVNKSNWDHYFAASVSDPTEDTNTEGIKAYLSLNHTVSQEPSPSHEVNDETELIESLSLNLSRYSDFSSRLTRASSQFQTTETNENSRDQWIRLASQNIRVVLGGAGDIDDIQWRFEIYDQTLKVLKEYTEISSDLVPAALLRIRNDIPHFSSLSDRVWAYLELAQHENDLERRD
ncbi:hypothetical protein BVX98_03135, partial [bacterium F11]